MTAQLVRGGERGLAVVRRHAPVHEVGRRLRGGVVGERPQHGVLRRQRAGGIGGGGVSDTASAWHRQPPQSTSL